MGRGGRKADSSSREGATGQLGDFGQATALLCASVSSSRKGHIVGADRTLQTVCLCVPLRMSESEPFGSLECPGGARSPCSGRGSCAEGMEGNGSCSCQVSSEMCSSPQLCLRLSLLKRTHPVDGVSRK